MTYDWDQIKDRFLRGETMSVISRSMGNRPTVSAIYKHAEMENWKALLPAQFSESQAVTVRKDRPEIRRKILELLGIGATYRLAAATVGIHPDTLATWRKRSPEFRDECERVRAAFAVTQVKRIDEAAKTDWRASRFLLQHHPDTRPDFGNERKSGEKLTVIFNIPRDPNNLEARTEPIEVTPLNRLTETSAGPG